MGAFQPWHLIPILVVAAPFVALVSIPIVLIRGHRRSDRSAAMDRQSTAAALIASAAGAPAESIQWDNRVQAYRIGQALIACTGVGMITLWGEWGTLVVPTSQLPLYSQAIRSAIQGMPV